MKELAAIRTAVERLEWKDESRTCDETMMLRDVLAAPSVKFAIESEMAREAADLVKMMGRLEQLQADAERETAARARRRQTARQRQRKESAV